MRINITKTQKPTQLMRYVDDAFILWPHSEGVHLLVDQYEHNKTINTVHNRERKQQHTSIAGCSNI